MLPLEEISIDTRPGKPHPVTIDGTHLTDARGGEYRIDIVSKIPYDFEELPYMITSITLYKVLYQKRVRGEARSVLDWLIAHIESGNIVREFYLREMSGEIGVHLTNISHALTRLDRLELIQRGRRGRVYLNPQHVFIGNSANQRRAKREWDERKAARGEQLQAKSEPVVAAARC